MSPLAWKLSGQRSQQRACGCSREVIFLVRPCQPQSMVMMVVMEFLMKMALVYQKLTLEGLFQVHMRLYSLCYGTAFQWNHSHFRFVDDKTEGLNSFPLGAQLMREGRGLDVKLLYLSITSFPWVTNSRLWSVT